MISVFCFSVRLIALAIGSVWFYVEAFKESALWFLARLIFPFAGIFFLFKYADGVFIPAGLILAGAFFFVIRSMIV